MTWRTTIAKHRRQTRTLAHVMLNCADRSTHDYGRRSAAAAPHTIFAIFNSIRSRHLLRTVTRQGPAAFVPPVLQPDHRTTGSERRCTIEVLVPGSRSERLSPHIPEAAIGRPGEPIAASARSPSVLLPTWPCSPPESWCAAWRIRRWPVGRRIRAREFRCFRCSIPE